jgi:predicted polyphosphate/ATP-dependent NAD kinase
VAACTVDVGTAGAVAAYATQTIPITAIDTGVNGNVSVANHVIPAGTLVEVSANGECTAGAGDLLVIIDWY